MTRHCVPTHFPCYGAVRQRLLPVWTVPLSSGVDLHNGTLVFAC